MNMQKTSLRRTLALFALAGTLAGCGQAPGVTQLGQTARHKVNPPGKDVASFKVGNAKAGAPDEVVVATAAGAPLGIAGTEIDQFTFGNRTYHLVDAQGKLQHILGSLRGQGLEADQNLKVFAAGTPDPGQPPAPPPADPPADPPGQSFKPNDEFYFAQWGLQLGNIPSLWGTSRGTEETVVAVIDTGIDYTHPDLEKRVILGPNYTFSKKWYEFGKKDPGPIDDNAHGTHCAGIIGATADNRVGIAGVAPGVKLMAVKVLDANGAGTDFGVMKGIAYAITHGAKIVSLSLGSAGASSVEREFFEAATDAGALLVAAAGNEADGVGFPAAYPGVVSVGAIDSGKNLASFSNHDTSLSLVAPGVGIMSTIVGKQYAKFSGTSMATPYVAGVAALVWSKRPEYTADQVREKLLGTAEKLGDPSLFGHGLVDAQRALAQ